jgi:hypothetical protein
MISALRADMDKLNSIVIKGLSLPVIKEHVGLGGNG